MIAFLDAGYACPGIDNDTRSFMSEDGRKNPFRIRAGQREFVGVTNPRCLDFHQNFTGFRAIEVHLHDFQRFSRSDGNGGTRFHGCKLRIQDS